MAAELLEKTLSTVRLEMQHACLALYICNSVSEDGSTGHGGIGGVLGTLGYSYGHLFQIQSTNSQASIEVSLAFLSHRIKSQATHLVVSIK